MKTKPTDVRLMCGIFTSKADAETRRDEIQRRNPVLCKVRVYERTVKAGRALGTVWCVVVARPAMTGAPLV